jgi:hypothetical protein
MVTCCSSLLAQRKLTDVGPSSIDFDWLVLRRLDQQVGIRSMKYSGVVLAALLSPMLAGNLAAQEADAPACEAFKVLGTAETRGFVDLGDVGPTGGDQRVGRYKIFDADGKELGVMHFSSIVMPKWESRERPVMTTLNFAFANGSLVATSVIGLPKPADPDAGPDEDLEYAVTGGTGDFAHASGTLITRTTDNGQREMSFDLYCGH